MTLRAFALNFRLRPILFFCPFEVMTTRLKVILPIALPDRPTISVTLKDGKYLLETRF